MNWATQAPTHVYITHVYFQIKPNKNCKTILKNLKLNIINTCCDFMKIILIKFVFWNQIAYINFNIVFSISMTYYMKI
jgi:hypothetical protein